MALINDMKEAAAAAAAAAAATSTEGNSGCEGLLAEPCPEAYHHVVVAMLAKKLFGEVDDLLDRLEYQHGIRPLDKTLCVIAHYRISEVTDADPRPAHEELHL